MNGPNLGAVWRIRNSEGAAARPDKATRQDGGGTDATKKANENGESYRPVRKINNSTIR